jgi:phage portal protein BeeE
MLINKPDIYLLDGTTKGLSLKSPTLNDVFGYDTNDRKADMSIQQAYTQQGWYKRCVDVLANSLVSMPWNVYRTNSEEPIWSTGQEIPDELQWFQPDDILYRVGASLALTGAAFAMKEGETKANGQFTSVTGLKYIAPKNIKVVTEKGKYGPDKYGQFQFFKRTANGKDYFIPKELIAHFFAPDPYIEQGPGSSLGFSARTGAQILSDLESFSSDQLRNGLIRQHVFVADKDARPPSTEQMDKWRRWIVRFLSGAKGTAPEIMQGLDTKEIGSSLADLQSNALSKDAREAITTAFGIPLSLVMSNASNYATAQADQVNFQTMTNIPRAKLCQRVLNNQVFADLGLRIEANPARLEVFQAAELQKAQAVAALSPGRVFVTRKKFTEMMGWEYSPEEEAELEALENRPANPSPVRSTPREVKTDVVAWRRKIKTHGRNVAFSPDALNEHESSVIRERLMDDLPLDEVFAPPYVGF